MSILSTPPQMILNRSLLEAFDRPGDQHWSAFEFGFQTPRQFPADFAFDAFRLHPLDDAGHASPAVLPSLVNAWKTSDFGDQRQQILLNAPSQRVASIKLERSRVVDLLNLRDDCHCFADQGLRSAGNTRHAMCGAIG